MTEDGVLYAPMGTFTKNTVASGNVIYASDHNTLGDLIAAVLNGNVDSTNLADGAVSTAKLADSSITEAKAASGNLVKANGWTSGSGTWAYASSTTFTVPSADAANMSVGTKIWITQTTSKYFYVTGISGTTITVTGGTDYTVANAAITSPYFSNATTPQGFPQTFNYTPTYTSISGGTTNIAKFWMVGKTVHIRLKYTLAGAGVSGNPQFTIPVANHSDYNNLYIQGSAMAIDQGNNAYFCTVTWAATNTFVILGITTNGGTLNITSTVPFTWGNTDYINVNCCYEAA